MIKMQRTPPAPQKPRKVEVPTGKPTEIYLRDAAGDRRKASEGRRRAMSNTIAKSNNAI